MVGKIENCSFFSKIPSLLRKKAPGWSSSGAVLADDCPRKPYDNVCAWAPDQELIKASCVCISSFMYHGNRRGWSGICVCVCVCCCFFNFFKLFNFIFFNWGYTCTKGYRKKKIKWFDFILRRLVNFQSFLKFSLLKELVTQLER